MTQFPSPTSTIQTVLHDRHLALGATMVEFYGWTVPWHYPQGTEHEHLAVRKRAGLFDISHMGRIVITGKEAEPFVDYLSANAIRGKSPGSVTYTTLNARDGGCIDDALIFRKDAHHFFLIVNPSNRTSSIAHLQEHAGDFNVTILDRYHWEGILSIQGPQSKRIMSELLPRAKELDPMQFAILNERVVITRTGYTGEQGYEVIAPLTILPDLWDLFLKAGVEPVGLAARESLRLEVGYPRHGYELTRDIAPTETMIARTVRFDKGNFLGKEALSKRTNRTQVGLLSSKDEPLERGSPVAYGKKTIGTITSSIYSPVLGQVIAIALVDQPLSAGDEIIADGHLATIVNLPFVEDRRKRR